MLKRCAAREHQCFTCFIQPAHVLIGHQQHKYCKEEVKTYEEVLDYIEKEVNCHMLTFDEMCLSAHYSPDVARGKPFKRFKCHCCGYSPATEAAWRADIQAFNDLTEEEQKTRIHFHQENEKAEYEWDRHYHQLLFTPPGVELDMSRAGYRLVPASLVTFPSVVDYDL